jgi:hypothetical protein
MENLEKLKGQSRMENLEKLTTLGRLMYGLSCYKISVSQMTTVVITIRSVPHSRFNMMFIMRAT